MRTTKKYSMSFTTAGLLRKETIIVALLYLELQDWSRIHQRVMIENCLQLKTANSRRRIFSEIKARLECLEAAEMKILCFSSSQDIDIVLWLALCRRYQFIGNFAREVLREKFITLQRHIDFSDYALFVEREAVFHPEILELRDSTCKRLRQMLFQFMRNCGMLNRENMILPVIFSPAVDALFAGRNQAEIQYFPVIRKTGAK